MSTWTLSKISHT